MSEIQIQVGQMSLPNHFYEFKAAIETALDELGDILNKEAIKTQVLTVPLSIGNSTGDFATLLRSLTSGEGSREAVTIVPRKLKQVRGAPSEVNDRCPLVVVIETSTSTHLMKAVLLHEFGHARKDYPTIWELLETTSFYPAIRQAENNQLLLLSWNPFGNTWNADPFREYVAQQLAARYIPQDVRAIEEQQLASLHTKAEEGQHERNYLLKLFLQIVGELTNTRFPNIQADSTSSSIVHCIHQNDFKGYATETITELLNNKASPLAILRKKTNQIIEDTNKTLQTYNFDSQP